MHPVRLVTVVGGAALPWPADGQEGEGHDDHQPIPGIAGINSGKGLGYDGPFPTKGHGTHHNHFKVYILDGPLDLQPGATKAAMEETMEGHIQMRGEAVATYSR